MRLRAAVAATVLLSVAAIVHSWTVFSQTVDEPAHVAAGVEWLDTGHYALDLQHPPLARIAAGIGPFLRGASYEPKGHWVAAGNAILYGNGGYVATLASARAGTLVFFLLGCAVVFLWTRGLHGAGAGVAALFFFATQPSVLGHASLATTDMAAAATIVAALWASTVWLDDPSPRRATVLGLAIGAALASKFSSLAFLPPAMLAIAVARRWLPARQAMDEAGPIVGEPSPRLPGEGDPLAVARGRLRPGKGRIRQALLAALVAVLVLASLYRFQPGILEGIEQLRAHNREGHPSYLFGEVRREGWWFYFPVALWFKSTLPLLVAFGAGCWMLVRRRNGSLVPLVAFAAILAMAMTSRISIGVRHVLPLYPLMAMVAGYAVMQLRRPAAIALVVLQLGSFALAHPDHLAYFNLTAGRDPSRILLDSNLDWGQDLFRLEAACKRHRIDSLGLVWFGSADPTKHRLPPLHRIPPFTPSKGWIAISEMWLKDVGAHGRPRGAYNWLNRYRPVERVGKSILLYRIP